MDGFGMNERSLREFLGKELERSAASTTFYWENDETEEVMDLLVDAFVKVMIANNTQIKRDWQKEVRKSERDGL